MKKFKRILTVGGALCLVILLGACKRSPTGPTGNGSPPMLQDHRRLVLTLTDFNVVRVTHQEGLDLRSPNVIRIGIGTKDSTGYRQSFVATTSFDPTSGTYLIHFDYSVRLDSSQAVAPVTVRYYLNDSTHADADTTVLSYKYPYHSSELAVPFSVLQSFGARHFQDVDRIGRRIFFHPMAHFGLYSYDLDSHEIVSLLPYSAGDHIAAESVFVFCDINHDHVVRFNLTTNAVDLTFPAMSNDIIRGVEVYEGFLYVDRDFSHVKKYTLDGVLVDSADFWTNIYLTIDSGIVYSVDVGGYPNRILRYDMQTGRTLPSVLSPARSSAGIKIYDGKLYYCDSDKRIIGAVPVADVR